MRNAKPFARLAVVGAGAWGTAIAHLAARNAVRTTLWAREPEVAEAINSKHENKAFLTGVALHPDVAAVTALEHLAGAEAYLLVVPAQHSRAVMLRLAALAAGPVPVALAAKGIERTTGKLQTEVLAECWPQAIPAVLSGPSFARDVALGLPTAVTLASSDEAIGGRWISTLGASHFRPYLSDDLVGAELGGAVKNVLAIAAGAVEGRGLGESARAALIARGFAEFQRLGLALGARRETMAGLSGLGDLVLTACSRQSRNYALGYELGKGADLVDILGRRNTVAEGVATAPSVVALAKQAGVETPICAAVAELVSGARPFNAIVAELLARPFRAETD
jgi:glycerol-3-phosphate dehydrogenase (NAD(P)+)